MIAFRNQGNGMRPRTEPDDALVAVDPMTKNVLHPFAELARTVGRRA
jgi:hypothetical protein